ncbi:peptidoglycan DD-metalloendopeptidase family protein [Anaerosalibacter massiliensis]|uniref:Peptidoglycan DD-metalloendopeptidase family protein n=2 Tax=Anaerosalibacter massiliensis TaxID=1347392 RepID=A0A9X2S879_9FIRM|nr:peptidoglycan DD-metalloendopeptidase family protein [Anaerosalibacter massiliensis]
MNFVTNGYVILIDGKEIGVVERREEAEDILTKCKEHFLHSKENSSDYKEVNFLEDINIVKKIIPLFDIKTSEEILSLIEKGIEEVKVHVVEPGENYWTIANKYNISLDDLIKANDRKDFEIIHPGDEVNIKISKPLLTLETIEEIIYEKEIEYNLDIEYDKNMYKNKTMVKEKGINGKSKIVERVVKHNGIEVDRKIIKEDIISKPVDEIIVKGTKKRPLTVASGNFATPTRGSISSRYGQRWGRMHKGIDIAANVGTPIKAADGGTITYSGYRGNYGKLVEIDHGNGYITRYGHCSELNVNNGDKVSKGQTIALVGNTGRTTGPHLHFEVIKNGVHQNPSDYLNK